MRALIYYPHGLGDVIMLTPCLRQLNALGYEIDLMVLPRVVESHLLDFCPYVYGLIPGDDVWPEVGVRDDAAAEHNMAMFRAVANDYEWTGMALHRGADRPEGEHKIDMNARELGIDLHDDRRLEVWTDNAPITAIEDREYVFVHKVVPDHPYHSWDKANMFVELRWPGMTTYSTDLDHASEDINVTFEILRHAKHRVLSSSVFVHAAEAMGLYIDCIYYGHPDPKVEPLDRSKVGEIVRGEA